LNKIIKLELLNATLWHKQNSIDKRLWCYLKLKSFVERIIYNLIEEREKIIQERIECIRNWYPL
jgi:hypothetical protein